MVDPTRERYDWSARRTAAWFAIAALAVVVGIRSLALAADAVGVQPTVAHYAFAVLPILVVPAAVLRLWSDEAFDHAAYLADADRRRLARDLGVGILVGYAAVPAYLSVVPLAPRPIALVYALVGHYFGRDLRAGLTKDAGSGGGGGDHFPGWDETPVIHGRILEI